MPSSPVPTGKRPDFKQSRSAGWNWPRLVPIHEQQSRLSQASQSSASPSLRDHSEQEEQPTATISTMISNLHSEEDAPLTPDLGPANRSLITGEPVAEAANHEPYEHRRDSLSSMQDFDDEKREVLNSSAASSVSSSSSVEDVVEKRVPFSDRGSVDDLAKISASIPERGFIEDTAHHGDTEIPVGYESTSMYLQ